MKKVLTERYNKACAAEIMRKSKQVYREIVERADDIGDDNPMAYNELFARHSSRRILRAKRRFRLRPCRR